MSVLQTPEVSTQRRSLTTRLRPAPRLVQQCLTLLPDRLAKRREQYREQRETLLYEARCRAEAQGVGALVDPWGIAC